MAIGTMSPEKAEAEFGVLDSVSLKSQSSKNKHKPKQSKMEHVACARED